MSALLVLLSAGVSFAGQEEEKRACFSSHEEGQKLRKEGKLRAARKAFELCAQASCPSIVSSDCTKWGAELQQSIPTVLVAARGVDGKETAAVKVLSGGEVLAEQLDGRAIAVDPGNHTFRFEHGGKVLQETLLIRETEQNRKITISFSSPSVPATSPPTRTAPPPSSPPTASPPTPLQPPSEKKEAPRSSSGPPTGALVLGGVGAVLLGTAAYFGLSANARYNTLTTTCANTATGCSEDQKAPWKTDKTAAFTSLGFGLAAVAGAGLWWAFEW